MKKIFVTYLQKDVLKKAELTEAKYSKLTTDPLISELTIYPNVFLMEQNYQAKIKGINSNKNILHG